MQPHLDRLRRIRTPYCPAASIAALAAAVVVGRAGANEFAPRCRPGVYYPKGCFPRGLLLTQCGLAQATSGDAGRLGELIDPRVAGVNDLQRVGQPDPCLGRQARCDPGEVRLVLVPRRLGLEEQDDLRGDVRDAARAAAVGPGAGRA